MPITQAELKLFGSADMPINDTGASGGAIALTTIVEFTPIGGDGPVGIVSDNAGDTTQSVTITGRLATGVIDTEVLVANGQTRVAGSKVWERILRVSFSAPFAGNVTVDRNADSQVVKIIPAGVTLMTRLFYDSASEASPVNRHEKIFFKNTNGSLTLTNATVTLTSDPAGKILIGLEASKDGTGSIANRKATPGGVSFVDDSVAVAVPGGSLAAGEAIGIWVRQALGAGDAPTKSTFQVQLAGSSI